MTANDWDEIGDSFYRKRLIYNCDWKTENGKSLNLDNYIIVGCPYGGPIAMLFDEKKSLKSELINNNNNLYYMRIYTPSSQLISKFIWKHRGVVKIGWSSEEHLITVLETGTIIIYNIHGKLLKKFNMGRVCNEATIADACIWSTGLVVRTAGEYFQLWAVLSFGDLNNPNLIDDDDGIVPFSLSKPDLEKPPVCIAAIDPNVTRNKQKSIKLSSNINDESKSDNNNNNINDDVIVLVSTTDGGVYCITRYKRTKLFQKDQHSILLMSVRSDGKQIATYDETGFLVIYRSDFKRILGKFQIQTNTQPLSLKWCGLDAVGVLFGAQIILAARQKHIPYQYNYNERIILISECDSLRVLTSKTCELISIVPGSTQEIFTYGSQKPAALLYDSYEDYIEQRATADYYRKQIDDNDLEGAILDCLDAAQNELEHLDIQNKLLNAAGYGKLFIKDQNDFEHDIFVETCRFLRVLNEIRKPNIGMPLTYIQFEILTPEIIVQRLIHRKKHLLALRISEYLHLPIYIILEHWACCKIENIDTQSYQFTIDKFVKEIKNKLDKYPGFSYAKIAKIAAKKKSQELAIKLIEYEPKIKVQILALLEFEEFMKCLEKSCISLNYNLICMTILKLIIGYKDKQLHKNLFELIIKVQSLIKRKRLRKYNIINTDNDAPYVTLYDNLLGNSVIHVLKNERKNNVTSNLNNEMDQLINGFFKFNNKFHCIANDFLKESIINMNKYLTIKKRKNSLNTGTFNSNININDDYDDNESKQNSLDISKKYLNDAMDYYEKDKLYVFYLRMCADHYRLYYKYQREIDSKTGLNTLGKTVVQTICILLENKQIKYAEDIRKKLEVSDKIWWHSIINSYTKKGNFNELRTYIDKFSTPRRPPPIGYLPIIESFIEYKKMEYAKEYILKLSDNVEKLEWLCQLKFWNDAVDVAAQEKDFDALRTINNNCNDPKVQKRIQDLMKKL